MRKLLVNPAVLCFPAAAARAAIPAAGSAAPQTILKRNAVDGSGKVLHTYEYLK